MAKKTTKAEAILQEARRRIEIAEGNVQVSLLQLREHESSLIAYREVYSALAEMLAPAPRKTAPKSQSAPGAEKKSSRKKSTDTPPANTGTEKETALPVGPCAVPNCGQPEDALIHESGEGSHKFHPSIKVRTAGA